MPTNARAAIAALRSIRRSLEELARLTRKVSVAAAPDLTKQLQAEFDQGKDPYGRQWAPLASATLQRHGPPPLTFTRRLRDGTKAAPMSGGRAGIVLHAGAPYGAFHQVGFRVGKTRVAPRRMFPNRGLPAAWLTILAARSKEIARKTMRGGR